MKVSNMVNNQGNTVKNQFIVSDRGCTYFQSYDTMIAKIDRAGRVSLDRDYWNYSVTTSKYRNIFLDCNTSQVIDRIRSKQYKLVNLNR